LQFADSLDFLAQLPPNDCPDVIYLDPIFPAEFKRARSNKYLHLLQNLCKSTICEDELFALAIKKAKNRSVIKRPIHAPYWQNQKPNFSLRGRSHRFDIYLSTHQ
jgi:16S rRNA (guanine1516-N2)-methyltransferase